MNLAELVHQHSKIFGVLQREYETTDGKYRYGFSEAVWNAAKGEARAALIDRAKA
jgi:hypothetical protein